MVLKNITTEKLLSQIADYVTLFKTFRDIGQSYAKHLLNHFVSWIK